MQARLSGPRIVFAVVFGCLQAAGCVGRIEPTADDDAAVSDGGQAAAEADLLPPAEPGCPPDAIPVNGSPCLEGSYYCLYITPGQECARRAKCSTGFGWMVVDDFCDPTPASACDDGSACDAGDAHEGCVVLCERKCTCDRASGKRRCEPIVCQSPLDAGSALEASTAEAGSTLEASTAEAQVLPDSASTAPECWQGLLTSVQPKAPTHSVGDACAAPASTTINSLSDIAGRWASCGSALWGTDWNGLEIGGNWRWRLLRIEDGSVVSASDEPAERGFIHVSSYGQVNLVMDTDLMWIMKGAVGATADALRLTEDLGASVQLARIAAGPANGADNLRPLTGPCSLLGTWDVTSEGISNGAVPQTLSFDSEGNFVVSPASTDPCAGFNASGKYWTEPSRLGVTALQGTGVLECQTMGSAVYTTTWGSDECSSFEISVVIDSCTGGALLRGGALLTRRK